MLPMAATHDAQLRRFLLFHLAYVLRQTCRLDQSSVKFRTLHEQSFRLAGVRFRAEVLSASRQWRSKGRSACNSREIEKVEEGVHGRGRAYFTPLRFVGRSIESVQQPLTHFNRRLSCQSRANFDCWSGALKSAEDTL